MQIKKECGCYVEVEVCDDGTFYPVTYCKRHQAAFEFVENLIDADLSLSPENIYGQVKNLLVLSEGLHAMTVSNATLLAQTIDHVIGQLRRVDRLFSTIREIEATCKVPLAPLVTASAVFETGQETGERRETGARPSPAHSGLGSF